jgi:hypothetical protein
MQAYDDPDDRDGTDDPADAPELIQPEDFLPPSPFPLDAQRMGIDRYTGESGALIGLAAALDGSRVSHRLIAWLLLAVVVGPFVMTLWTELGLSG